MAISQTVSTETLSEDDFRAQRSRAVDPGQPKPHSSPLGLSLARLRLGRATRAEQQGRVSKEEKRNRQKGSTNHSSDLHLAAVPVLFGWTNRAWRSCAEAHLSRGSQEVLGPTAAMELV